MPQITMRQMLEAGVHFGHQTRYWNPKMAPYIFGARGKIHIINLESTMPLFADAMNFISGMAQKRGTILFVGTKRSARDAIAEEAARCGMPYVSARWLGGMLTNFQTVHKRLLRMKELESIDLSGTAEGYTKRETLQLAREKAKLTRTLGGLRDMQKLPSAVWVVDTKKEHIAVDEARKLGIPVIAILDTNCDPDEVDYPIPGNDDAIRSAELLTRIVASAVADGLIARSGKARGGDKPEPGAVAADQPLAEWERELLEADGTQRPAQGSGQTEEASAQEPAPTTGANE